LIDHIGSEKTPMQVSTAVRNLGQWPNGWTGNLEKWQVFQYGEQNSYGSSPISLGGAKLLLLW